MRAQAKAANSSANAFAWPPEVDDGTTTVVPTPTTASPAPTVTPNTNVRPAKGAKPRAGTSRYTG